LPICFLWTWCEILWLKETGGEIEFSSRVEVWLWFRKVFGAVKRTNALVLLFLR
jgi:hypothetical protein